MKIYSGELYFSYEPPFEDRRVSAAKANALIASDQATATAHIEVKMSGSSSLIAMWNFKVTAALVQESVTAQLFHFRKSQKLNSHLELQLKEDTDYLQVTGRMLTTDYTPLVINGDLELQAQQGAPRDGFAAREP